MLLKLYASSKATNIYWRGAVMQRPSQVRGKGGESSRESKKFHWVDKAKKTDEILTASLLIDRGAVLIMEVGIDEGGR